MKCPRCKDWRTNPDAVDDNDQPMPAREQLAAHAVDAGHPRCICCLQILGWDETRTCEGCLTETAGLLAGIVTMRAELPEHLARAGSSLGQGGPRGATDGRPLLGGDALVLLGPGSEGLAEDGETSKSSDSTSVAFELCWWETEWRQEFGEPDPRTLHLEAAVRRAHSYLERRNRRAAREHLGFDTYRLDLLRLHARLEAVTGRSRQPSRANAACFGECGGQLMRRVDPTTGLEEAHVTCNRCRRRYSPGEYLLALRATRESGLQGWVSRREAARFTRRSDQTLESWSSRGLVATACEVIWDGLAGKPRRGKQLVWWPDVEARLEKSQRRTRRTA